MQRTPPLIINNNENLYSANPVKNCAKHCTIIHSDREWTRKDTHLYNHCINTNIQLYQSIHLNISTGYFKHGQITLSLDDKKNGAQTAKKEKKQKTAQAVVVMIQWIVWFSVILHVCGVVMCVCICGVFMSVYSVFGGYWCVCVCVWFVCGALGHVCMFYFHLQIFLWEFQFEAVSQRCHPDQVTLTTDLISWRGWWNLCFNTPPPPPWGGGIYWNHCVCLFVMLSVCLILSWRYLLNCSTVFNQTWYGSVSYHEMECQAG